MRLHYFQHVPFEDLGEIAAWAEKRGDRITRTAFYQDEPLPALDDIDALVVMGGPMNIYEEDRYPWLRREKAAIAAAIAAGKHVLGICLGAQLIADVLCGAVTRNQEKEIGWFPIVRTADAGDAPALSGLPADVMAFHWHGDTFAIPPGARHVAQSTACTNQAFLTGERVLGLQFHLESTQASIERLLTHCAEDLTPGQYVQHPAGMLAQDELVQEAHRVLYRLLDGWISA